MTGALLGRPARAAGVGTAAEGEPAALFFPGGPQVPLPAAGKSSALPGLERGAATFPAGMCRGEETSARLPGEGMGSITDRSWGSRLKRHPGERVGRRWNPDARKVLWHLTPGRVWVGMYLFIFNPRKG